MTLKQRWVTDSPKLFKKITNLSLGIASGATFVLAISQIPGIILPDYVFKQCSWVLLISTIIGVPSKLTIKKEN